MAKILGLDLGTNSIGWALIEDNQNKILGLGTRIFPMGVENLGDGEGEISKNAATTILRTLLRSTARGQVFLGTVTINLFVSASLELTIK